MTPLLEFRSVSKSFSGIPVLKDISFKFPAGHLLGLVGENGAGKSTLMNLLGGNFQPDAGEMYLDGESYSPRHPRDATQRGVAFIHQELNLFSNLTVGENLFITDFPTMRPWPIIDRTSLRREAAALLERVGLAVSPDTLVERLSAGEQQLVEIAKALSGQPRLILFDEPTTSLTSLETDRLFQLIGHMKARGLSLIYISHNLEHVLRLADDMVVLRDGELVGNGPRSEFELDPLVSLMVGRRITHVFPTRPVRPPGDPLLEVRQLSQPGIVAGITFTLHRGEVLGLSGLMGSGRSELARIVFGLEPFARGQILLNGKPIRPTPRRSIENGVAFLTEDRRAEGLCLDAALADNIALVTLPAHSRKPIGWLDRAAVRQAVNAIRQAVRISPAARPDAPVQTLSGGNQQKVVLAKWLLAKPAVFILDEPTRGIDLGAKSEIYRLIHDLSAQGTGVLLVSSEIEELIGLCDRILVMRRGEIAVELGPEAFDRERILAAGLSGPGEWMEPVNSARSPTAIAIQPQGLSGHSAAAPLRDQRTARTASRAHPLLTALNSAPLLLFIGAFLMFGLVSHKFFALQNIANILVQSSSIGLVAIGMTFVLLTAGVDLSVGALMFACAAVAGKLTLNGAPLSLALSVMLLMGVAGGMFNAFLITRLRIVAFIATLATLYLGRGFALWVTQTRAMNLPDSFLLVGTTHLAGVPLPILIFAGMLLAAHLVLRRTTFGRQIYAVGQNAEAARKAGINAGRIAASVYVISGFCAALGGIVSLAQLGAVSPTFGTNKEFSAIAAAVLGGTSLFGGRGQVIPGTFLGAVLIQTIENGLVILNADPYLYPILTSAIIFLAVLLDSLRTGLLAKWTRRRIRIEEQDVDPKP